jgi:hypothetical protein
MIAKVIFDLVHQTIKQSVKHSESKKVVSLVRTDRPITIKIFTSDAKTSLKLKKNLNGYAKFLDF